MGPQAEITSNITFEASQQYSCEQCNAKCCRFPWKILLDQPEYERLINIPWVVDRLREKKTWFIQEGRLYRLPRGPQPTGGMACVFLDEDNRCAIQVREGHDILPFTCQSYPFSFIEPPEGRQDSLIDLPKGQQEPESGVIHAVTSFFCRSILYNYGMPIRGKVRHKLRQSISAGRLLTLPPTVRLGKGLVLQPDQYQVITNGWLRLFDNEQLSLQEILWLGRQLLEGILVGFPDADAIETPRLAVLVDEFLATVADEPDLFHPPKKANSQALGQAVLTLFLYSPVVFGMQDRDALLPRGVNMGGGTVFSVFWGLLRQKGVFPFWGMARPVDLAKARQVRLDVSQDEPQALLKRYYRQFFQSQWLFYTQDNLLRNYLVIMSTYPYILRLAKYHAYSQQRDSVMAEDLLEAIGHGDVVASLSNQTTHGSIAQFKEKVLQYISKVPHLAYLVLSTEA